MRTRLAVVAVMVFAALLPASAAVAASGHARQSAGSMWSIGSTSACQTAISPPPAPPGEVPIMVGTPGRTDQWCWAFARLGRGSVVFLPGGVPGERLSPAAYARQTGQSVTVVTQPDGREAVYLS